MSKLNDLIPAGFSTLNDGVEWLERCRKEGRLEPESHNDNTNCDYINSEEKDE